MNYSIKSPCTIESGKCSPKMNPHSFVVVPLFFI